MPVIQVYVSEELYEKLLTLAKQSKPEKSVSRLVRELVEKEVGGWSAH